MNLVNELGNELIKVYEYWEHIPAIQGLDEEQTKISRQEVRGVIIEKMRTGIEDTITKQYNFPRRHSFTAQELLEIVNEELEKQIKISNIYFHLDKLIEIGLVQEIATIKDGRHKIRYYGRTAKLFLMNFHIEDYAKSKTKETLTNAIELLNPDLSQDKINQITTRYQDQRILMTKKALKWVKLNHDRLKSKDIDFVALVKTLRIFYFLEPEMFESVQKIANLIGFNPQEFELE